MVDARRRVALVVEYDGTRYQGFQLQANASTVQGELERAVASLTLAPCRIQAAGRTDTGAHAAGQVAAFSTSSRLPCKAMAQGLNHFLPLDVAVQAAYDVPAHFDPRRHALSRVYRYTFLNRAERSPLRERFAHRVAEPLDDEAMGLALRLLEGVHDFASFGGPVASGKSTLRHVLATRLWRERELVQFEVEANAFLPHQMRRIAGMLVMVGTGRLSLEGVCALRDRRPPVLSRMAPALPARGLSLMQVKYEDFPPHGRQTPEDI
ncbi:MAG: tRNA pseudouridine(38-40) synthase TruA [Chloroflexi bacterium]|nr:tRNA pseudouridine(38-40) synthase TruA [Chloroflexota bacterium]